MARLHFTVESVISESTQFFTSSNKFRGSLSTAVDLGRYFRLGVTHRQEHESQTGYSMSEDGGAIPYEMNSVQYSNSVDFTLILYYGKVFVPYVTLGVVKKASTTRATIGDQKVNPQQQDSSPVPNSGVGMGIRLNRNFSLKLSYNVSPSLKYSLNEPDPIPVLDSFTSVGISYSI